MRVLALSGSLREGSLNRVLLRAAASELPPEAELEVWEELREVPPYDEDQDTDPAPEPVRRLREAIARADAVLVATPEYNGSVPGQLKNVIDWASRPFPGNVLRGKPFAVIGASTGLFGAVWAQAELRKVLSTAGAEVVEHEVSVGQAGEAFDAEGRLRDPELRRTLATAVDSLVGGVHRPVAVRTASLPSLRRETYCSRVTTQRSSDVR